MYLEDFTLDQLLELNHLICSRIDELREKETLQALIRLHVGMKVTFEARDGVKVGLVTKINRKSVIVLGEEDLPTYFSPNTGFIFLGYLLNLKNLTYKFII